MAYRMPISQLFQDAVGLNIKTPFPTACLSLSFFRMLLDFKLIPLFCLLLAALA